jgi:molybdopterin/thiamine biosynthesis adenylyltransferase
MSDYFKRQIELWGEKKQNSLQEKRIAIIGSGGLGSSLSLSLGSIGVGEIHLVDFDEVALHNIHRQIAFRVEDVTKKKADVVAELIESRSEYTKVIPYIESFAEWEKRDIEVDLIIDGTDNLGVRVEIDRVAKERGVPWIYGSVEGFYGQVCFFRDSSFSAFQTDDVKPKGVSAPIVMNIASFQANLAIKYLIGDKVESDLLYYLSFDKDGIFRSKSFKMPKS